MIAESLRSERGRKILEGIYTRTRVSGYIEHPDSDSSFVSLLYNFFVDFAKLSLERRWRHCPQLPLRRFEFRSGEKFSPDQGMRKRRILSRSFPHLLFETITKQ